MRTSLALSFASVVLLAFASGCSDESTRDPAGAGNEDVTITGSREAAGTPAPSTKESAPAKSAGSFTTLHGKFADSSVPLDNARALAITDDNTTYSAHLDAKGEFTLELPVGVSYRIVFVNQLAGGGQVKLGHLSFKSEGRISVWFGANAAGEVDLGTVSTSGDADPSPSDHSDDPSCEMDASRASELDASIVTGASINVCLIWPSVELRASVEVGDAWADKDASVHSDEPVDDDKSCARWTTASGAVVWGAPWSFEANGQVVLAGGIAINASFEGSFQSSFESSFQSSFQSSFYGGYSGYAAGGFYGGFSGGFSSSISGGWAVGVSASASIEVAASASVCVTAQSCGADFSCVADTCQKR